jgi:putative transposase
VAAEIVKRRSVSISFACVCMSVSVSVSESCYYYQPKLSSQNAVIADWLLRLTTANKRWGFGLCYLHLRNVRGFS